MAQKPIIAKAPGQPARTVRAIQTKSIKMVSMKRLFLVPVLVLSGLLTACGGGGTSSAPAPSGGSGGALNCSLPLQYANGGTSGLSINPQAVSVDRYLSQCGITQVQSATLTLCTDHPNVSELTAQLRLAGNVLGSFAVASSFSTAKSCLINSGGNTSLREFTLSQPDTRGMSPSVGPWSLIVNDTLPTNNQSGYFVAWSLDIQGQR